jgi:anaerobic dimethyl sulfoxide reductase subunit A
MEEVITGCPYDCGGSCPLKVYVEEGEIKRIAPDEEPDYLERPELRPCARGLSQVQRIYHPDRLRYPMKRVGERGKGKFERISWEEALDTVAKEMQHIKRSYGAQAILNLHGAGNVSGRLYRTAAMADRFFNCFGGQTASRGNLSYDGAIFAARHTFGFLPAPPGPESLLQSKLVILWGMNPGEALQGTNTMWYFVLAKERGVRFILVDPRFTESAAILANQWIPILPGTDVAMLIAMAYIIIQEKLCDEAFLHKYTYGFEKFRSYCLGVEDGIPKTPAWAEAICGVRAEVIIGLAREYATSKPADLRPGWAPGRTAFGEQFYRACIALATMTGNIGIPGGGTGCWVTQDHQCTLGVTNLPSLDNPTGKSIVAWRWADAVLKGTAGGYPSDIKMIYSVGGNRLNQCGDINKGVKALKKVEFVLVQDLFLTPLARFADILLPVSTHFEREDIQVPYIQGNYLIYNKRAIKPFYESKSDLEIFSALAQRLGIANFNDKAEEEWLEEFLHDAPVDAKTLRQQGIIKHLAPLPQVPLQEFITDPENNPLSTPSGKIELFSQTLAQRHHPQLPGIPKYIESWESPQHPIAKEYPLLLVTPHSRKRVHSTHDNIPWLRELEPHTVEISSTDAQARGIKPGDQVKVHNDIGTLVITAKVTERIIPGVVCIYQGAWYQPDERGLDWGGCVNVLCKGTLSPGEAAATNAVLVEVSK